ncbi:amino acid/amide ABC transporter substrate-binding protein, HAAT family [Paraburkholderia caribensis MBA4]|uniref:Amino acid/amide ABC transporter substrate-binding protein, HAAT family n=1 Tax=Paraburkholderia caribensis MBA4 TaxID=1323664 RepID=A0A0P0RHX6_9BURK|nr:ABC transporter substrate-binding protein [Paraburkholderia caribensis]ALL68399.1 amino acid/amide ABC transporter substrate-binding protein, HAAT family [Paraburkholderia caribensis MBA4]
MNRRLGHHVGSLLLAAAPFLAGWTSSTFADEVKVGVVQVLTGPASKFGGQSYKGIQLAADEINATGGIKGVGQIKLITQDTGGNKEQAVNAFRRLIAQEQVSVILGPTLSIEALAAGPVSCQRNVPMVTVTSTAKGIPDVCPYVFRTSLVERQLIPLSVQRVQAKYGIKRAAIFYANDDPNMVESLAIYKDAAARLGIQIVDVESFSTRDTDFSAQLTKVKALNVDAIFTGAYPDTGASILTQAAKLGLPKNIVFVGGNGFNSPNLISLAGSAAEGVIVSSPWFINKPDAANVEFVKRYRDKYHQDPDTYAAQGYQGMMLIASAVASAGSAKPEAIRNALANIHVSGLFGQFSFAANRDPAGVGSAVTLRVTNGRFEPL